MTFRPSQGLHFSRLAVPLRRGGGARGAASCTLSTRVQESGVPILVAEGKVRVLIDSAYAEDVRHFQRNV